MSCRFYLRSITLTLLLICFTRVLPGCSCSSRADGPTCGLLDYTDTVFLGRAVARLPLMEGEDHDYFYVFEVIETFLGNPTPKSLVLVDPSLSTCLTSFDRDGIYLVRAKRGRSSWQTDYRLGAQSLSRSLIRSTASIALYNTSQCAGNAKAEDAVLDIRKMRLWKGTAPRSYLYGIVGLQWKPWPFRYPNPQVVAGATIQLQAPDGTREAISGPDGTFEIHKIPPGTYRVSTRKAPYRDITKSRTVTIPRIGCGFFDPILSADSYIEGLLLHHDGTPAKGIPFEAQRQSAITEPVWDSDWTARTDTAGHFRIGPLSDGPHILISNGQRPPTPSQPYPRSFYPGVASESHAKVVSVRATERRHGLVWILPPPSALRRLRLRVIWPNGEPVSRAEIRTFVHRRFDESVETDKDGRAAMELLAEVAYDVEVWFFSSPGNTLPKEFSEAWAVKAELHVPSANSGSSRTIVLNIPEGIAEGAWY